MVYYLPVNAYFQILEYIPVSGISVSYGKFMCNSLRICFPIWFYHFIFSSEKNESFHFPISLSILAIIYHFVHSHFSECEMVNHCTFSLHFQKKKFCCQSFYVVINHQYILYNPFENVLSFRLTRSFYWVPHWDYFEQTILEFLCHN